MSSSRLRDQAPTMFDVFCEIVSIDSQRKPTIVWRYPEDFDDEKTLKGIVEFSFPTSMVSDDAVQLFTFVFTDSDGRYSFGYCRHTPAKQSCFCVLSALPWTDVFYRLLNHVAGLSKRSPGRLTDEAESLLVRTYHQEIPAPGERVVLDGGLGSANKLEFVCPDDRLLPRIPDSRNLTEYYNAVREENMLAVFASLLCERRIVFTSSKLGKLSACVLAASNLLYPMYWQHIFIPVLPDHLVNYLHAPMPFLIGVPTSTFLKLQKEHIDLSEVVILHLESNEFVSPFNDLTDLPNEVVHALKKNLRSSNHLLGDGVARSFLRALVVLLGGYREALRFRQGERITFSEEAFVQSRPPSMRRFLENMLHLQIFHQFVEDRLTTLNNGDDPRDEFEEECHLYSAKEYNRFKSQYNEWIGTMRKEGGALIKNFSKKVKTKGRDAISDIRLRFSDIKDSAAGSASGRQTPSPAVLRRIGSAASNSSSGQSPRTYRQADRTKSAILHQETHALKDNADDNDDTESTSGPLFGFGGVDLLGELQGFIRPSSFIERLEKQHEKLRGASPAVATTEAASQEREEPLVSIIQQKAQSTSSQRVADEPSLIDLGPSKVNADDMDITDFDPFAAKSNSIPVSPTKRNSLQEKRPVDGKISLSSSSGGRLWETFE